jgi:hypothetical protein
MQKHDRQTVEEDVIMGTPSCAEGNECPPNRRPVTLTGAVASAAGESWAHAEEARRALARRDVQQAFRHMQHMQNILNGHLTWESQDLPGLMDTPELLDMRGDSRSVRAWLDLLIDGTSDMLTELCELHDARGKNLSRLDHALARLQALVEDYQVDLERSVYRSLDEDVERHDSEPTREQALNAWGRRVHQALRN